MNHMVMHERADIVAKLQKEILRLEGFKLHTDNTSIGQSHGLFHNSFPGCSFPLGAVHEFLSSGTEASVVTGGFIAGLLSSIIGKNGVFLWISTSKGLFPPALTSFGLQPDRFIFIRVQKEKDVGWTINEALKCNALSAVIGEMRELSFTESRRLQLSVEQSQVTGFIIRTHTNLNTTACATRWRITSLPSESVDDFPGLGFPKWKVELLRMRNGKPGSWEIVWRNGRFVTISSNSTNDTSSNFPALATSSKAG
jgi:protein ImuA